MYHFVLFLLKGEESTPLFFHSFRTWELTSMYLCEHFLVHAFPHRQCNLTHEKCHKIKYFVVNIAWRLLHPIPFFEIHQSQGPENFCRKLYIFKGSQTYFII